MELAKRLRAARGYAGFSQPELAERLGFSTSTLKRIELGERTPREWEQDRLVYRIAKVCGLPANFFLVDFGSLGQAELDDRGCIVSATADDGITLGEISGKVDELLERWREEAMPAFTAYLDAQAAEARDGEDRTSGETSAPRSDRRP